MEQIQASRGVVIKESVVEIAQESPVCTYKGQTELGGMDDLAKEICHFIGKNYFLNITALVLSIRKTMTANMTKSHSSSNYVHHVAESFSRVDAYVRLGIPNKKAVVVSGVAGSGKKTIIT